MKLELFINFKKPTVIRRTGSLALDAFAPTTARIVPRLPQHQPPINDMGWAMSMERSMWEAWLAENRKMLLGPDMTERRRGKSWFQWLIQHMFDINRDDEHFDLQRPRPGRRDYRTSESGANRP
jgi:hypothetical protein